MKKSMIANMLQIAIENLQESGPGKWTIVDHYEDCVQLCYTLDVVKTKGEATAPHPDLYKDSDAIWSKWGGREILNAIPKALKIQQRDAGADGYTDKYGDDVYSEYINLHFDAE
jgi:hypothetical protein